MLGLLAPGKGEGPALRQRHLLERVILFLDVGELPRRRPVAENSDSRRVQPNSGQPGRLWIREWPQQQSIYHAEDRRICPYANRKRDDDYQRRKQILAQHTPRVPKI